MYIFLFTNLFNYKVNRFSANVQLNFFVIKNKKKNYTFPIYIYDQKCKIK